MTDISSVTLTYIDVKEYQGLQASRDGEEVKEGPLLEP